MHFDCGAEQRTFRSAVRDFSAAYLRSDGDSLDGRRAELRSALSKRFCAELAAIAATVD